VLRLAGFELRYQLRRVATWVYFVVFGAVAFLVVAGLGGAFGGDSGDAISLINSPHRIAHLLAMLSILGVPVTAAFAGNAVYRDFHTGSYPLFFTTPIRPASYLAGRWLGAVAANFVALLGGIVGALLACAWPTVDPGRVGAFDPVAYLVPLGVIVIPNLLFTAAIFVTLTALTRKMLPTYAGGMALLVGWAIAQAFTRAVDEYWLTRLGDPFALAPLTLATRYWTLAEQNALRVPLGGPMLWNRVLWLAVGAAVFALGALAFRFRQTAGEARSVRAREPEEAPAEPLHPRPAARSFTFATHLRQLAAETRRSIREVVANVWFYVLVGLCLLFVSVAATQLGAIYGTRTYPVTYKVLELVGGTFVLFVVIIITFYSGELVWNERESRAAGIHDSLPVPTWVPFLARFLALLAVVYALQAAAMACGMAIQAAHGYTRFEPGLYLRSLFFHQVVSAYLPILVLALLVQTLVNHKYVGYLAVIAVYVGQGLVYFLLGVKHNLLTYGGMPALTYSDMNGFGHSLQAWRWFALYWTSVGALLLVAAHLFWVRGRETGLKWRLRLARRRLTAPLLGVGAGLAALVLATGGFIYYNTNVLNHFESESEGERIQATYEKRYKRFEWVPQPRLTAAVLDLDVFPRTRDLRLRGAYTLTNRTAAPIDSLHIDLLNTLRVRRLAPDRPARRVVSDSARGYYVFRLERPLAPGDSLHLRFDLAHETHGFTNEPSWQPVVNNGTFFNSQWLPHVGYQGEGELTDERDREKHGLPPRPRAASIGDARARTRNFVSSGADWIAFDVTLSTDAGQTAVAPGYLQRSWTRGGRRYFHYRLDAPIRDFYAILSARYAVRRDRWKGVALEVYYHPDHAYNVGRMLRASKAALEYCTREFGPYQHRQLRILEFPRYAGFAQSFDNTIPYSEEIGFIADVRRDDIDYPYFVTAHEVAHQWWGHQEAPADVQGAAMLSETLAEYTALMVMEKEYGREKIGRFLRYELDQYLEGRGVERRAEKPLVLVENQQYIHYNKGALAMYALRDYLGEEAVNGALRAFLAEWRFRGPPYPTSLDLMRHLRAAAPDSLKPVVEDLFSHVTLWENRAVSARTRHLPGGRWEVTLTVEAKKLRADSLGNETPLPVRDWLDVGVYAGDSLVYLARQRFDASRRTFRLTVAQHPDSAGIDPQHKLIDRRLGDNVMRVAAGPAVQPPRAPAARPPPRRSHVVATGGDKSLIDDGARAD
jgi:ABC-type transport system involved in multi-copper enzyme maturation permease subunit